MTPGEPRLDDPVLLFIGFIIIVVLWKVRRIVPVRVRLTTGVLLIALALLPEDVATSCIDALSY